MCGKQVSRWHFDSKTTRTFPFVRSNEPGTLRLPNLTNEEHPCLGCVYKFCVWLCHHKGYTAWPLWKISEKCIFQRRNNAFPVPESNRKLATFWPLTRRFIWTFAVSWPKTCNSKLKLTLFIANLCRAATLDHSFNFLVSKRQVLVSQRPICLALKVVITCFPQKLHGQWYALSGTLKEISFLDTSEWKIFYIVCLLLLLFFVVVL